MYECKNCGMIQQQNRTCEHCEHDSFTIISQKTLDNIKNGKIKEYRRQQFNILGSAEYCEYKTKIKFIKPDGETNWLDIESSELQAIILLLI